MKYQLLVLAFAALFCISQSKAQGQDTIIVQTFTYGSPQDAWFNFPPDTAQFEKILMQYTLKCNPAQNPACGEWDYQTSTYLYDYTGLLDSAIVHQPIFTLNGNPVENAALSYTPTYTHTGAWEYFTVYDDTTQLSAFSYGDGSQLSSFPFASSKPVSRAFYLWKADELAASGMASGDISGMRFNIGNAGSPLKNLTVRMKSTPATALDPATLSFTGFTEVFKSSYAPASGWNSLPFLQPFFWNGTSSIIVEVSFENKSDGTDNMLLSTEVGFSTGLVRHDDDRCVAFHAGGFANVPLNDAMLDIDSTVSVSFWAYGTPELQPQDGTCFEATNVDGNRIINGHVPWSNLGVYWDAGNEGSNYDRINKTANTQQTEGQWNHWVFTKNAGTGIMKIYLNGALWHNGTGQNRTMEKISRFLLGRGTWSGAASYEGRMDEFAVFNSELSAATISQYAFKPIDSNHPDYDKLVVYYHFDDQNGISLEDGAGNGGHAPASLINASNPLKKPSDFFNGFTVTTVRPDAIFEQGVFAAHIDSVFVQDPVVNNPWQVLLYTDSLNNPGQAVDTITMWAAGYFLYNYDSEGNITDSVFVTPDTVLTQAYYDYFRHFPQVIRYEMGRYITPYGNGLDLGDGWTWTFDVSDYRTLLADSVRLAAGNWQELLDLKFVMIKGTPSRNIISIQNLWNGNFDYGYPNNNIENRLTPLKVRIPDNAASARWKSRVTGHAASAPSNCAEFCPKSHYYKVDGAQAFSRLVWRDNCDLNPLYPQGGTWVYDRANWCPGAEVETYDFELGSSYVTPGDTLELDHDVEPYTLTSGWSYYQIEDQLVTYGPANFSLDAAIENVLAPTSDDMWRRMNPICAAPVVVIKNNGNTSLTSLDIEYGIEGTVPATYHWAGNLAYQQTQTVTLGTFPWAEGASSFRIYIKNPNGGSDQYAPNDSWKTQFNYVASLPDQFAIELRTNNFASENSYTLSDGEGNIVFQKQGLQPNTTYRDTMYLTPGCYMFRMVDTGEDGLQWWANPSQGSGHLYFRRINNNIILKNFKTDFGGEVYMQFVAGEISPAVEAVPAPSMLLVYPNPANDVIWADFSLPESADGSLEVVDMFGKRIMQRSFNNRQADTYELALGSSIPTGVYFVVLRTEKQLITRRIVVR